MSKTKSLTLADPKPKAANSNPRFRSHSRAPQESLLVWLDPNVDENIDDEHRAILEQVRSVIERIHVFSDVNRCLDFLGQLKHETVFVIVTGTLGRCAVPQMHSMSQLDSIYIFCGHAVRHERWAKDWNKVQGVFTQIAPLCDRLSQTMETYHQHYTSLSFLLPTDVSEQHLDPSFMYTQILKEILLEIRYNDQSMPRFVSYCRAEYAADAKQLSIIDEFERDYEKHTPIWWYTHPGFIHSMLNRALRTHEVDTMINMGFFIRDLHEHIQRLHVEQTMGAEERSFVVYRGQGLSKDDFEKLLRAKGGLISFNNFLSTSKKRAVSLEFALDALHRPKAVGVLFKMVIDPSVLATPFALLDTISYFQSEEEILFSMHTVFRIGEIKQIRKTNDRLYQVILTLTHTKNKQLSTLTELLRDETCGSTGWHRLGMLLIKLGKFNEAEEVYRVLCNLTSDERERALFYHQFGLIRRNQGNYTDALSFYEKALSIYQPTLATDTLDVATIYNNIGHVHSNMGNDPEALSYYQKSLDIHQQRLEPDHPSLAISYNNIGLVYKSMGDYSQALASHMQALDIEEKILPSNHPSLAISYNNIGLVYGIMGLYSDALSHHEKALSIEQSALPSNHPSLAITYNSIGLVFDRLGEYLKALSFYEKTLEIYQKILSGNHPDLAMSYNNIGSVYKNCGEYLKALCFYQKTLDIEEKLLPAHHPSLAITYSNIGLVYDNIGEYSKALSSHQRALAICQRTLPASHPLLATSYNNIGSVHDSMGDYRTALSYYEKSLAIERQVLSHNHPDLATSYNNIGQAHVNLGDYTRALASHIQALEIYRATLPSNHPNLANSYNNLASLYTKMKDYYKAISSYEQVLDIHRKILPSNHPDITACYGHMSQVYEMLGDHPKALSFYEQWVRARDETPSLNHSYAKSNYTSIDRACESMKTALKSKPLSMIRQAAHYGKRIRSSNFRKKLEASKENPLPTIDPFPRKVMPESDISN